MAPEQLDPDHAPLSAQTDVYGLGALLYTLVTGHAVGEAGPEPPEKLMAIILRALEREPEKRFASAAEFAEEVELGMDSGGKFAAG